MFQCSNQVVGSGNQPPHSGASKSHLANNTRHLCFFHHLGNPKGFRSSVPGREMKPKYIFLILSHNITHVSKSWPRWRAEAARAAFCHALKRKRMPCLCLLLLPVGWNAGGGTHTSQHSIWLWRVSEMEAVRLPPPWLFQERQTAILLQTLLFQVFCNNSRTYILIHRSITQSPSSLLREPQIYSSINS